MARSSARGSTADTDPDTRRPAAAPAPRRGSPPRWLRVLLPTVLILVWFAAAGIGGPYFGKVDEVSSNDATSYLPSSADATKVQAMLGEFSDSDAIPAIAVFVSDAPLGQAELGQLREALASAGDTAGVGGEMSPIIPSEDGLAAQAFVPIASSADVGAVVSEFSDALRAAVAQQDIAGAFVRVRWTVAEEDRHQVDRAAIERLLEGAAETKLEGRILPVVRTRAAGISQLANLADKVRVWAQVTEARAEPLLECLQALASQEPEAIAERVLRGQEVPDGGECIDTAVTLPPPRADLEPALSF